VSRVGGSDARTIEALDEAGFAGVRVPQCHTAPGERAATAIASGECPQIGQHGDGRVVLTRFAGGDQCCNARPHGLLVLGQLVQPSFPGERVRLRSARFLLGTVDGGSDRGYSWGGRRGNASSH
jgi:hypothetical protein